MVDRRGCLQAREVVEKEMICCEICNRAGDDDICKETGNRIEWDVVGITVMKDCPERKESDYEKERKENDK